MASTVMIAALGVGVVDVALSAALVSVYARNYAKVRAPFTLGLILFAAFFFAQNLLAVYAYLTMMEFVPPALAPYMLGITAFEGMALGVMVYASYT